MANDTLEDGVSLESSGVCSKISANESAYLAAVSSVEDSCFSCNMEPCRACYGPLS